MTGRCNFVASVISTIILVLSSISHADDQELGLRSNPFEPTPREGSSDWMALHNKLVREVDQLVASEIALDVLFYGDSITEFAGRGTCFGQPCKEDVHAVWQHMVDDHYQAEALAIAGDRTPHLLWRIQNGEFGDLKPKVIVILIGTNDLGAVMRCRQKWLIFDSQCTPSTLGLDTLDETAERAADTIEVIARELLQRAPAAQLLLQAILPRGYSGFEQPSIYTEPIGRINRRLQSLAASLERTHCCDCGGDFVTEDGSKIIPSFMPDSLHPSAAGEVFMLNCLKGHIDQLLPSRDAS